MQKAQVSIFIIIGLVLLFGGILFFTLSSHSPVQDFVPVTFAPTHSYLDSCLQDAYFTSVAYLGNTGGVDITSVPFLRYESLRIPEYVNVNSGRYRFLIPDKQGVLDVLDEYMSWSFNKCVSDYSGSVEIDISDPYFLFHESNGSIEAICDVSATLTSEDKEYSIKSLHLREKSCIGTYVEVAEKIVFDDHFNPSFIDYTLLESLQEEFNIKIHPYVHNETSLIYTLTSKTCIPEQYVFAVTYASSNFPPLLYNNSLILFEDRVASGYLGGYDENGDEIIYETQFPAHTSTGYYYFTPTQEDVGMHFYDINLSDGISTVSDELIVVVYPTNDKPVLDVHDFSVSMGDIFSYRLRAYDEDDDNDTLIYTLLDGPEGMVLSGNYIF
jgi:hypothetical protein